MSIRSTRTARPFPVPGTRTADVYHYVTSNPGVTTNAVIVALKLNPSVARKSLRSLEAKGLLEDKLDARGFHCWKVKLS